MKHLDHFSIISISGADSTEFIQGQMTQDISAIGDDEARMTAILNPQGRVMSTALIMHWDDSIILVLNKDTVDDLIVWLSRFILRSKVTVSRLEAHIYGLNQNLANIESDSLDLEKEIFCLRSIETDAERTLLITKSLHDFSKSSITTMSSRNWQLADIQAGIPIIYKENIAKFIPQMVNLDLINGISFNKGCYTGQEIVARVQHRGKIKRRMFHISTQQSNTEIRPGTPVLLGDSEVGTIIQSEQYKNQIHSLAVIKNDASNKKLLVNGSATKMQS
jgi:folate-binding protein YgfZ